MQALFALAEFDFSGNQLCEFVEVPLTLLALLWYKSANTDLAEGAGRTASRNISTTRVRR